jgi:hypothetical protein
MIAQATLSAALGIAPCHPLLMTKPAAPNRFIAW